LVSENKALEAELARLRAEQALQDTSAKKKKTLSASCR
jgi:hypothetical protein